MVQRPGRHDAAAATSATPSGRSRPYVDPPLAAVSLAVTAAKITAAFYEHGAPGLRNALNWSGMIGTQERAGCPTSCPIRCCSPG